MKKIESRTKPQQDDRIIKSVAPPPRKSCNWQLLLSHLKRGGRIQHKQIITMINLMTTILKNQPNTVHISDPVTIVGDIHGQFYDLLKVIDIGGSPEDSKYLFLGDYVDRGSYSIEVLLLFALKITYPNNVILLRGNHQCRQMTSYFNFKLECLSKYNQDIYDRFIDLFNLLPLVCILNNKFFCVHGGLSPELKTLDDINKIDRFKEIPQSGLFCDLLWSDPTPNENGKFQNIVEDNNIRGCSYFYGLQLCKEFLCSNRLVCVIRAHEVQSQGFKFYKWINPNFPTVMTIFSAPNYCDVYNNQAAVIKFIINIQRFKWQEQLYKLPNFMDAFSWSLPFVAEKVMEMLYNMIRPDQKEDITNQNRIIEADKEKLIEVLMGMQRSQSSENMRLIGFKGATPDNKLIESGIEVEDLIDEDRGKEDREKQEQKRFNRNKKLDQRNQFRPEK